MGFFMRNMVQVIFALLTMVQIGLAETIVLSNGASFEAKIDSVIDGYHILEIPQSQIAQVRYGSPDYIRFINNTDVSTQVLKFVENKYYIKVKNSQIGGVDLVPAGQNAASSASKIKSLGAENTSGYLFRMHGSNTIGAKLAPALVKRYLADLGAENITEKEKAKEEMEIAAKLDGKEIKVEINSHGSTTGFGDLENSLCDIGMASRRIKDKEVKALSTYGDMKSIENEHVIAIDGVAIFVNQKNSVFRLNTTQIKDIYTGSITDWSQVGGEKAPITLYARDNKSGTWDTFNSLIMNEQPLDASTKRYEDNTKLSEDVSADVNGIGFGGLPYILNSKELAISDGEMTIRPDKFTVATEDYPLSRRLYLYTKKDASKHIKDFIEFVLSSEGQKIVDEINFIDLNIKEFKPIVTEEMPTQYRNLAQKLTRLSTNFRFETNSKNLDNKAKRDLVRVVKYLKDNKFTPQNIYLVGFTDNVGSAETNVILSQNRAKSLLHTLKEKGVAIDSKNIVGIGEDYPVANNSDDKGRNKNRRVEIWVKK